MNKYTLQYKLLLTTQKTQTYLITVQALLAVNFGITSLYALIGIHYLYYNYLNMLLEYQSHLYICIN